jgi:hypothetical protein
LGVGQSGVRDVTSPPAAASPSPTRAGGRCSSPPPPSRPATGAAPLGASRVDPRFAQVYEVSSRYESRNVQATAALNGFTGRGANFNLSWTVARNRDQVGGGGFGGFGGPAQLFNGTPTAGNPNVLAWAPGRAGRPPQPDRHRHLPGAPVARGHRHRPRDQRPPVHPERAGRRERRRRAQRRRLRLRPCARGRPRRVRGMRRAPRRRAGAARECLERSSAAWPAATAAAARGRPGSTSSSTTSPTASASSAASP